MDKFENMTIKMRKRYAIFLSQVPVFVIDDNQIKKDYKFLVKNQFSDVIEWLNFGTIYFFEYKGDGDDSPFAKEITLNHILAINYIKGE